MPRSLCKSIPENPFQHPRDAFGLARRLTCPFFGALRPLAPKAGPEVTETYIDFFTSTIRNRNTRAAYARACWQFFDWCGAPGLELKTVRPFHVAPRIEDFPGSKPTVRLKLAAVRMLYDFLVVRQITPSNPALYQSAFVYRLIYGPNKTPRTGKTAH